MLPPPHLLILTSPERDNMCQITNTQPHHVSAGPWKISRDPRRSRCTLQQSRTSPRRCLHRKGFLAMVLLHQSPHHRCLYPRRNIPPPDKACQGRHQRKTQESRLRWLFFNPRLGCLDLASSQLGWDTVLVGFSSCHCPPCSGCRLIGPFSVRRVETCAAAYCSK